MLETITRPPATLVHVFIPNQSTSTRNLALATIAVARNGYESSIIEDRDIKALAS